MRKTTIRKRTGMAMAMLGAMSTVSMMGVLLAPSDIAAATAPDVCQTVKWECGPGTSRDS